MDRTIDWYKKLIVYQIYPRSFKDGNGDGIGDLKGMTEKLDYLKDLGINAIWMSPVYASPNVDNGYDISDYYKIMEEFGTMEDWEIFKNEAHLRGIAIIMDLVLNHTSDQHIWFQESKKSRKNPYSDYYIWKDPLPDGGPPTKWSSCFGGGAWEFIPERNQYYLHLFAKEQPDLNWSNPETREKIFDIIRFWNNKGVDGYRIDAISYLDKGLDGRADLASTENGTSACANLEGTHQFIHEMVEKTIKPTNLMTVGEVIIRTTDDLYNYSSQQRGEFDMTIGFIPPIVEIQTWSPERFKQNIEETYLKNKQDGWWARFLSNHDKPRQVSLYGDDQQWWKESAKMLCCFLHTLPGTPFVYQGEEIGMTNCSFQSIEEYDDIDTRNFYQELIEQGVPQPDALKQSQMVSRDNARTPIQWNSSLNAGFSSGNPWLPVNKNYTEINVESQLNDDDSILNFYKKIIGLRKEKSIMIYGDLQMCCEKEVPVIAYTRSYEQEKWLMIHNFSKDQIIFKSDVISSSMKILLGNYKDHIVRDGEITLRPFETMILT